MIKIAMGFYFMKTVPKLSTGKKNVFPPTAVIARSSYNEWKLLHYSSPIYHVCDVHIKSVFWLVIVLIVKSEEFYPNFCSLFSTGLLWTTNRSMQYHIHHMRSTNLSLQNCRWSRDRCDTITWSYNRWYCHLVSKDEDSQTPVYRRRWAISNSRSLHGRMCSDDSPRNSVYAVPLVEQKIDAKTDLSREGYPSL